MAKMNEKRGAMKIYDATLPMENGMVGFPGDPVFHIEPHSQRNKGDAFNLALLSMGTHSGTHVDPPAHALDGGATIEKLPLDSLLGPGVLLDVRGKDYIDREVLENGPLGEHSRVLLKTDNGPFLKKRSFYEDYVYLTEDGARFLVEKGVRLVGIDYLSIERYMNPGAHVHRILLEAGVVIVEGVNLVDIPAGPCEIFCLPLCIKGGDGAPARVLVRR